MRGMGGGGGRLLKCRALTSTTRAIIILSRKYSTMKIYIAKPNNEICSVLYRASYHKTSYYENFRYHYIGSSIIKFVSDCVVSHSIVLCCSGLPVVVFVVIALHCPSADGEWGWWWGNYH